MYRAYGTTVDEFLRSHPVTTPDYIKIDVDGIEHAILEGPRETFKAGSVKSVPVEVNENFSEQWRVQALRCAQRIPTLGIPSAMRGVVSLYDVTDDWIPIYDSSSVPGFYMAIGSSGNQFKNAPIAGAMMAHLIENVQSGHDHDEDALHFTGPHTGCDINIGFYSRKRKINPESSFSVLG